MTTVTSLVEFKELNMALAQIALIFFILIYAMLG